jgi:hypothetical protein
MAVHHCRGLFLFLFWTSKKEKMNFLDNQYSSMFFWLEPKEPKIQGKTNCSAGFAGPTHMNTPKFYKLIFLSNG